MWQYISPANWVHNKFRVSSLVVYFLTPFFQQFWKNIKRQWSEAEKSTRKAQKKEENIEEHDQQKRIFTTFENDLLYVLDSAYLPPSLALLLSLSLSIRS